jgi:hypothetical protein
MAWFYLPELEVTPSERKELGRSCEERSPDGNDSLRFGQQEGHQLVTPLGFGLLFATPSFTPRSNVSKGVFYVSINMQEMSSLCTHFHSSKGG